MPATSTLDAGPLWWGFVPPCINASAVHVGARFANNDALVDPGKLLLMPVLLLAAPRCGRRLGATAVLGLLMAGLLFSWLGDGAGTLFPFAPTLPLMALMALIIGLAHLCYMRAFWRHLAARRLMDWFLAEQLP